MTETYKLGDKVFVYQGTLLYEAKIIKSYDPKTQKVEELKLVQPSNKKLSKKQMDQAGYLVHYLGWNTKWDEWVGLERMLVINNDNMLLKERLEASIAQKNDKKQDQKETKRKAKTETDEKDKGIKPAKKAKIIDTQLSYNNYRGFTSDEIKILVPDEIKMIMVDDWENITKDHKLLELPAKCSVNMLLKDFSSYIMALFGDEEETLDLYLEIINSLKQYFNKALGTYLLYRYERMQYMDMLFLQKEKQLDLCDLYSSIFLVRMLTIFPNIMTHGDLNIGTIRKMKKVLNTFWKWINDNRSEYLIDKYENQTPSVALLHT